MDINTIALDIAKDVFQTYRFDKGRPKSERLSRGKLERFMENQPRSLIVMEACGTAHYWARRFIEMGHEVKLIPAAHVKAFVRRNKTDARDAEAIHVAASRPGTYFVPVKSAEQQVDRALHKVRDGLVRDRTAYGNELRAHLSEHGVIAAQGKAGLTTLLDYVEKGCDGRVPARFVSLAQRLARMWRHVDLEACEIEREIKATAMTDDTARRLMTIPGVGPITAHAVIAAVGDGKRFSSARDFAAWIGLTPLVKASGKRKRIGEISRAGDGALRRVLTLGASSLLRHLKGKPDRQSAWVAGILARRPVKVAVVAQAAKTARVIWAVLTKGGEYEPRGARADAAHALAAAAA